MHIGMQKKQNKLPFLAGECVSAQWSKESEESKISYYRTPTHNLSSLPTPSLSPDLK